MSYKIVLTVDRTMASNYRNKQVYGIASSLPESVMPQWIHNYFFVPSSKVKENGELIYGSTGMRKIEAALIDSGIVSESEIIFVHPEYIEKVVNKETEIIGISTFDPLGIGPVTSTFTNLISGESHISKSFKNLLKKSVFKNRKIKIIAGGPGAWQLIQPDVNGNIPYKEFGIDVVVIGEGEITLPKIINEIRKGNQIGDVFYGETVPVDKIPNIKKLTVVGTIEVTRGCYRKCKFCNPTNKEFRSRSIDDILIESELILKNGGKRITFHAEDIMHYGAKNIKVNSDAVINLFETVSKLNGIRSISATHATISSVVSAPDVVRGISEILGLGTKKHPGKFFQVGIESGSKNLMSELMPGKISPFKFDEWHNVVIEGFKILTKNHIIPISSIIFGLPGETKEDILETINLVKSLRNFPSLITPFYFVSMGNTLLDRKKHFSNEDMGVENYKLLALCWEHNFFWAPELYKVFAVNTSFFERTFILNFLKIWGRYTSNKVKKFTERKVSELNSK